MTSRKYIREWSIKGTKPKEVCAFHDGILVCRVVRWRRWACLRCTDDGRATQFPLPICSVTSYFSAFTSCVCVRFAVCAFRKEAIFSFHPFARVNTSDSFNVVNAPSQTKRRPPTHTLRTLHTDKRKKHRTTIACQHTSIMHCYVIGWRSTDRCVDEWR